MRRVVVALIVALAMVLTLSVPTRAAESVVVYEYAVITGIVESRHDDIMETIVVEVADGNIYDTATVVDDYALGDIVLIRRFKADPVDPTDDWVQILNYVGWEQWYPVHMWNVNGEWIVPIF